MLLVAHNGSRFKVIPSGKSAVADLEKLTIHPVIHLVVVSEDEKMTWGKYYEETRLGHGDLASLAHSRMKDIVAHFLPGLNFENAAWRFEINSPNAASRPTVHTHIIIGHENLFGTTGFIRRSVDSALTPKHLVEGVLQDLGLVVENTQSKS